MNKGWRAAGWADERGVGDKREEYLLAVALTYCIIMKRPLSDDTLWPL